MKHYYSFLVLSLFVFLSLVCPSPVMADCTNSMSLDVKEDRVIPSACPCGAPGNLKDNANYYDYAGFFWDWKGSSNGELYYKVTLPASTYSISISIANAKNAWMNIYSTTYSSNGTCTVEGVNYYKQSWHDMDQTHGEYQGSFKTETASSISLSAGTYIIGIYGENYTAFSGLTITAASDVFCESSCTAPNHVDVTGNYRFTPGETISLTAAAYSSEGTGSPITSGITYQWQKYNGSTWDDLTNGGNISGATSDNLQISSCTTSNGGSYRCKASTGSGCDKYSDDGKDAHFIRIWTFNGNYNDEGFIANNITWTGTNTGTVTLTLNANSTYKFKVFDNDGKWFGCNSGITADASNWTFRTNEGNCSLTTGKVTGEYTFTIDISNAGDNNISVSVTYPMMTIYMDCGSNGWCNDDPVFFAHTWKGGTSHNVKMTAHACESGLYYADIPSYDTDLKFTRQKPGSESIAWNGANFWNQSENITIGSNNKFTNTGWNTSPEPDEGTFSGSTYSPSTYTITFAGNGNSGGSMSNVTAIPCGEDRTLVANGFTKTGHSFTNWIANVDVKINGATVTAGSSISNEATIQDITQNITLTAQWAPKTTSVTLEVNTANHGATGSSVTATWGTDLPVFVAATGVSGYALTGYFTAPTGGTKIINADGTLAASTTYTTADSKWNSELSALTLYPQYESSISPKTVPCSLGFYYTEVGTGAQDKVILDSDFSYSCNKDNAKNDQHNPNHEVCFSGSGHTLTSRMNVVFPQTGTYKFTFPLYIKERVSNLDAPRVTVNGSQSDAAYISTDGEENQNFTTTLTVTAGTYTVSVEIGNTNEKVFFSTMEIESYQCRNIITTGAVGLFDSNQGSGGGASYTCSSVADPECHFDHNVFCFEYSNMGGNSSNYYGCRLTSGPAYTPNAAATGFAFWYRTESGSDPVYMEFAGQVYKLAATNRAWHYAYVAADDADDKSGNFDIWINGQKDGFSTTQSSGKIYLSELQATNVTSADPIAPATTHIITVASNNNTYGTVSSTPTSGSSVTDCASITVTATPESGYGFVNWTTDDGVTFADANSASTTFMMPSKNVTVTANFAELRTVNYEVVGGNGTVACAAVSSGGTVVSGKTLTFTATPDAGYSVLGWYTYDGATETLQANTRAQNSFNYTISSNITIRVKFTKIRIATGDANVGSHDGYADNNASMSVSNVVDPASKFDHKVLQITYTMNSDDNESSYYGMSLPVDAGYSTSIASGKTGMGFWYRTASTNDQVLMYFCIGGTDGSHQFESLLPATNQKWQYWYIATDYVDDNTTFGFYINGTKNGKSSGVIGSEATVWLSEVEPLTPADVTVWGNETKEIAPVVEDLVIYQGGEVTNSEDVIVTGSIAYHRHAKGGALTNKLDQWYTFAVPFTVSGIEVKESSTWYAINAVYYSDNNDNQSGNPDGPGHFYLQYLKNDTKNQMTNDRWMYINPAHSEYIDADTEDWDGYRYGYPKKDSAYIILFDSTDPIGNYFETNTEIRFVGGPQTIAATAWTPDYDVKETEYWMYANNTLHSITLTNDAYVLNESGTMFVLEEEPTIRPFECYIQATEEFKLTYASIPMRRPGGNTPTAIEDIELNDTSRTIKVLHQGHLIIIRNGQSYNLMGARVR